MIDEKIIEKLKVSIDIAREMKNKMFYIILAYVLCILIVLAFDSYAYIIHMLLLFTIGIFFMIRHSKKNDIFTYMMFNDDTFTLIRMSKKTIYKMEDVLSCVLQEDQFGTKFYEISLKNPDDDSIDTITAQNNLLVDFCMKRYLLKKVDNFTDKSRIYMEDSKRRFKYVFNISLRLLFEFSMISYLYYIISERTFSAISAAMIIYWISIFLLMLYIAKHLKISIKAKYKLNDIGIWDNSNNSFLFEWKDVHSAEIFKDFNISNTMQFLKIEFADNLTSFNKTLITDHSKRIVEMLGKYKEIKINESSNESFF